MVESLTIVRAGAPVIAVKERFEIEKRETKNGRLIAFEHTQLKCLIT